MQPFTPFLLPFTKTNCFDKLILDYLNDDVFMRKFYAFEDNLEGLKSRLDSYNNPRLNRENLKKILQNQYKSSGIKEISKSVLANIESLDKPNTFTITAGHQLNIFGGPLYIIYKLLSAINLAESLNTHFPSNYFVPVYWMATEDHDIEEISSINIFGRRFSWDNSWKGVSGKTPKDGLQTVIDEFEKAFGSSAYGQEIVSLMNRCYSENTSLAEATRRWINELLGKYGLVIIEGNDKELKNSVKDIFTDEIVNQSSSSIISKTINELKEKYHSQAKPREINLFYIGDNFRERIIRENEIYKVLNTELVFTKEQILDEINLHPEKFSPNVIMRPLYQVSILPDIAFVGGPAEIAYWLELNSLFDYHKVPMPVLFLRSNVLVIDKNISLKLEKLSIKNMDLFLTTDELIKTYLQKNEKEQFSLVESTRIVSEEFKKLGAYASAIDPTLKASIEAENQKISSSLRMLEEKIIRIQKKKNETEVNQIRKIKEKLFPVGKLQEREDSFLSFYLNYGIDFINLLKENLDPLKKQFLILVEQKSEQ